MTSSVHQEAASRQTELLNAYDAAGLRLVPLRREDKKPLGNEWQTRPITRDEIERNLERGGGVGVQAGECSGWVCAADLDCEEARKLAPEFLLDTLTSGKASEPHPSHYVYISEGAGYKQFKDTNLKELIALKASNNGAGHQFVVEPSVHEVKGPYKWTGGFNPSRITRISPEELEHRLGRLAAATLIAKYFPPLGGRHEYRMMVAGFLLRNGESVESAREIMRPALEVAGANRDGLRDLDEVLEDTADKLRRGEPVKGGASLRKSVEYLPSRIAGALGWDRTTLDEDDRKSSPKGEGKPNQIDLVNRYIAREPDIAYGVGSWRRYSQGVWSEIDVVEVEKGVLEVLKEAIPEGITPSSVLLSSVVTLLRVEVHIPSYMWADSERGIIVCQNGTLEIEGRNFREHRREDYALYSVAFDYNPDAKAPIWEAAFKERLGDSWNFLQEYAGYSLTTSTDLEASAFLIGPLGCGKSTFIEGLEMVAGDQAGTLSLADIERSHYALANIPGKTLLTATEAPNAYLKSTATLDTIVSGEMIQIEKKYHNPERVRPVAKILWAMNELPQVRNPSAGIFRRAQVVPFPALKDKGNPLVKRAIKQEGSGILNWALDGLDRLSAQLWFTISEEMREATDGFKAGNDVPAAFIEAECKTDNPERREPSGLLYQKYREWCLDNGYKPLAVNRIGLEWERLGIERVKINGKTYYKGVQLLEAPRFIP
jgi:P4 family phage/plasmid primase-like protien